MVGRHENGYIALLAVLVIGAAATAIGTTVLLTGIDSQRTTLVHMQSKQARSLAIACTEEALQQIHDDIAFSGTANLSLGAGDCSYTVAITAGTTRTITATGMVDSVVKKVEAYVTIGTTSISITSWGEVS